MGEEKTTHTHTHSKSKWEQIYKMARELNTMWPAFCFPLHQIYMQKIIQTFTTLQDETSVRLRNK